MSSAMVRRIRPAFWWAAAAVVLLAALAVAPTTAGAQGGPLGSPAGLTATSGPGVSEVTLAWTPAANAAAQSVWPVRADGSGSRWHNAAGDANTLAIDGLEAGGDYWFVGHRQPAAGDAGRDAPLVGVEQLRQGHRYGRAPAGEL